ncbi:CNP1-like family protein [Sulfuritalea sp.]|uniref:CNP1-like family protein n=1 Tax=Sulfuritalea sp. TaxID=2480090 RepID=UPI00286D8AC0|nr:CNP1-like family protein [Sulfuritalea sp.]
MKRWAALFLAVLAGSAAAQFGSFPRSDKENYYDDEDEKPWQEQKEVDLPAFPNQADLAEFYVSSAATNKFFIDASTLAVGADGVVRYVLVVKASGGATNVSFEGINCKDRSWKLYATGRSDNSWNRSQASRVQWRPIENKPVNRHHAALSRDFFCPGGIAIYTADEGRNALRLGKHPNSL